VGCTLQDSQRTFPTKTGIRLLITDERSAPVEPQVPVAAAMEASTSTGGEGTQRRQARNSGSSGPTNLTVVQYNVLSDALSGADAGFTSLPPDEMDFSARGPALVKKILSANADIVCLQEADHYHDLFSPQLFAAVGRRRSTASNPC